MQKSREFTTLKLKLHAWKQQLIQYKLCVRVSCSAILLQIDEATKKIMILVP